MARQFFVKFVNIQSQEYPFSGSPVHMTNEYRQTDRLMDKWTQRFYYKLRRAAIALKINIELSSVKCE